MTPRDRRALRLGAAVIVIAVSLVRVVPAAARWSFDLKARVDQERTLLLETETMVHEEASLEDSVAALTKRIGELAPTLLHGQTSADAEADLNSRITLSAERQRLTVAQVVAQPDSTVAAAGTLHRVTVRATLTGDLPELFHLLDTLAASRPTLTPAGVRIVAPEPGAPPSAVEALNAELTVTGWYLANGAGS